MPHDSYGSYGWAHDHFGPHPAHQGYGQPMPPVPARLALNMYFYFIETSHAYLIHVSTIVAADKVILLDYTDKSHT